MRLRNEHQMSGELIAVAVACLWTLSALFFEYGSHRIGALNLNLIRLVFGFIMLGITLTVINGSPFPVHANRTVWIWMSLSGAVGFVLGDYFLFSSYTLMPVHFSQLIMTLAPPFAAVFGFFLLGERMSWLALLGMCITLFGIGLSVLKRAEGNAVPNAEGNAAPNAEGNAAPNAEGNAAPNAEGNAAPKGIANFGAMAWNGATQMTGTAGAGTAVAGTAGAGTAGAGTAGAGGGKTASPLAKGQAKGWAKCQAKGRAKGRGVRLGIPVRGVVYALLGAFGQGLGIVLSKEGLLAYHAIYEGPNALYVPLAATQIRAIIGIFGFALIILLKGGGKPFMASLKDRKGVRATFLGSIFGPFLGVTLSLLAVEHANTAVISTIMAMVPILILLPERVIQKREISAYQWVGALISVAGVALFFL